MSSSYSITVCTLQCVCPVCVYHVHHYVLCCYVLWPQKHKNKHIFRDQLNRFSSHICNIMSHIYTHTHIQRHLQQLGRIFSRQWSHSWNHFSSRWQPLSFVALDACLCHARTSLRRCHPRSDSAPRRDPLVISGGGGEKLECPLREAPSPPLKVLRE